MDKTISDLRNSFSYDPDTGYVTWIAVRSGVKAGARAGSEYKDGYRYIRFMGKVVLEHRIAWALHYGEWPAGQIDHINMARSDNRISNLRTATLAENNRNRAAQSNNKLGVKGVSLNPRTGKYRVRLVLNKQIVINEEHDTLESAQARYASAAEKHHGEFARH